MTKLPRISATEWEIMRAVWEQHPIKADDIVTRLQKDDPSWHPITAKTLINRLVKKGALSFTEAGRAYLYSPAVNERDSVIAESNTFLTRVFDGSIKGMVSYFLAEKKLTPNQVKDLKKVLDAVKG